jgi:hypothetical protein
MSQAAARGLSTLEDLPDTVRAALADYASDPARADLILRVACTDSADPLPLYRVLYKFYNRQRRFEIARDYAMMALSEAAQRARLPADCTTWTTERLSQTDPGLASQALLAIKAQAFLALRCARPEAAQPLLEVLARLDPSDGSGASVVQALANGQ